MAAQLKRKPVTVLMPELSLDALQDFFSLVVISLVGEFVVGFLLLPLRKHPVARRFTTYAQKHTWPSAIAWLLYLIFAGISWMLLKHPDSAVAITALLVIVVGVVPPLVLTFVRHRYKPPKLASFEVPKPNKR